MQTEEPERESRQRITEDDIRKANGILEKYRTGKKNLEDKIVENEEFWKLRHWESAAGKKKETPATAWLWNMIISKHADMEEAYPEPEFLARAQDDEQEAKNLSAIVPVILEQNDFAETYSDCAWYKLKQGASCYGVFWDPKKIGGLGDVSIRKIDFINLFWEPGITDIQSSRHVFHTELVDNEVLEQVYPETKGKLGSSTLNVKKYLYDDQVDTSDKSIVVDWYYHTEHNGNRQLHLCKYVDNILLFSSENDSANYPDGWYAHGQYPFVVDSLYDIEGSICGYGYTDICKDTQIQIDRMSDAMVKNTLRASRPKIIVRSDGSINVDALADYETDIIYTEGDLGEDSMREFRTDAISGNSIAILEQKIAEMKETTGNNDASTGSTPSGVTAASAIAALQEMAGKTSRDLIKTTYKAYKKIIYQVIDLIREHYTVDRQFRIIGDDGSQQYLSYNNSGIQPQKQPDEYGVDGGYRLPVFDIIVSPQKASPYSRMEQNELSLQFYQSGFYNPQNATQALACLESMDFNTKDTMTEIISRNGTIFDKLQLYAQLAYEMALKFDPQLAMQLQQDVAGIGIQVQGTPQGQLSMPAGVNREDARVAKARQNAAQSTQPY